jgi:hypothetical protein
VQRRNRLRITVHHDRFVAVFFERIRRVTAAIIELNAFPDADRAGAENQEFLPAKNGLCKTFKGAAWFDAKKPTVLNATIGRLGNLQSETTEG